MDKSIEIGREEANTYVGIIGCYNSTLGQGIAGMIENDVSFYLLGVFSHFDSFLGIYKANPPDFCLVDSFFLRKLNSEVEIGFPSKCKILLIEDIYLSPKDLHMLVVESKLSGIIYRDTNRNHLRKAIFKVLSGELWFRNDTFETLFNATKEIVESKVFYKNLLTPSEIKVAREVCQGLTNREIARRLFISENTVKSHLYKIYQKLNIKTRTELMKICVGRL